MPDVIWIHPSWIFVQGHQEDVLLFVGGVEREDAHHDEVRDGGGSRNTHRDATGTTFSPTHCGLIGVTVPQETPCPPGDGSNAKCSTHDDKVFHQFGFN